MSNPNAVTWRNGFKPAYWVANILELFERFAFYGSKAVLAVYLANKIGLGAQAAGSLAGLYSGLIFSLPIIAGTFVDRYGFRKTLMACFAMFSIGYFLIGLGGLSMGQGIVAAMGKTTYITSVLVLTAIGGSLIKPCIVGTVAKTSHPDVKALGYSIYYTLVNIGGAIGPILALQVRENFGIEYVLVMSSLTSLLLLFGTFVFFKEPEALNAGGNQKTLGQVFRDMLLVFRNFRFISFLIIFSGFWMMFWQIFFSFPFYVTDVLKFPQFELMETVDAWTIILVGIPMTALVKKWRPITAMTLGFALASCCWLIIAGFPTITAAIIGVAIFAFGEATQAPRFYEYVSALAPKDQVGTFMGFAFLPVAIGSFVGGPLGGWLVQTYLRETMNPAMMWYIVAGIGFVSTALMVLYNMFFVRLTQSKPQQAAMNINPKPSRPVLVCAFGLLAAFFMPWVQLFGVGMSGYNLGQLGSYGNYAWVIPILAGATILLSFSGVNNRGIGVIAGIVPLGAILYGLIRFAVEEGRRHATNGVLEIAGQILSIGAWLTIIFSIAIIIAAVVQTPAATSQSQKPEV